MRFYSSFFRSIPWDIFLYYKGKIKMQMNMNLLFVTCHKLFVRSVPTLLDRAEYC